MKKLWILSLFCLACAGVQPVRRAPCTVKPGKFAITASLQKLHCDGGRMPAAFRSIHTMTKATKCGVQVSKAQKALVVSGTSCLQTIITVAKLSDKKLFFGWMTSVITCGKRQVCRAEYLVKVRRLQ